MTDDNCVVCGGLTTVGKLAMARPETIIRVPVCKNHILDITAYLEKKRTRSHD